MRDYVSWAPGLLLAVGWSAGAADRGDGRRAGPAGSAGGGRCRRRRRGLRSELETLRQDYASRIAALETRLRALEGAGRRPHRRRRRSPSPAQPAAGASKVFNPDIAVIGDFLGAAGAVAGRRRAGARDARVRGRRSRRSSIPTRAPTSSSRSARTRSALEEGFVTFPTLPGGLLDEGRQDARRVRQGEHACTPTCCRGPTGRSSRRTCSAARTASPTPGISVARLIPNPWLFLEATGQVFRGDSDDLRGADARRPELRRPPARLPGPHRVDEHRPRRSRSPTATTASTRPTATTRLFGVDATCAGSRCGARSTARSSAAASSSGAGASRPTALQTPSAATSPATTSSRAAGSPALRYDRLGARRRRRRCATRAARSS